MEMATLTTLPHEILHAIFSIVEIPDIASVRFTCRSLHQFVSDNRLLFKDLYLQRLDEPPIVKDGGDIAWEEELHKLAQLERILSYDEVARKTPHLKFVEEVVKNFTSTADGSKSKTVEHLTDLFSNRSNKEAFFCQSNLWTRARIGPGPSHKASFEDRQASAHLHCLYGVPILHPKRNHFYLPYPYACSMVYDLRNYTDGNFWGPFIDDGSGAVDWERIEAVMIVLGQNIMMFTESASSIFKDQWTVPFSGASPNSFRTISPLSTGMPTPPADLRDPYNVTGSYMRVICFLDFQDLYHYNFAGNPGEGNPRHPIDTREAIRFIAMELTVTEIEAPGEDDGQELPVVYFTGTSKLRDAMTDTQGTPSSNIRGSVRLTKQGEVRWTSFSVYWGEERWKSEGIQIGGVGSARGVLGHWFDKNLSIEGPVGPSAFWKLSNGIGEIFSETGVHSSDEGDGDVDDDDDYAEDEDNNEEDDDDMYEANQAVLGVLGTVITISF